MVDPLPTNPSFGLPPEIPTGTSTPVPDDVVFAQSTPSSQTSPDTPAMRSAMPKQTLIDALGPEAVSTPYTQTPEPLSATQFAVSGVPKSAPAPAPAPETTLPDIAEAPFEHAIQDAPKKVIAFGIPAEQSPSEAKLPTSARLTPESTPPAQSTPAEASFSQSTSAMERVSEAARRASIRTLESDAAETIHNQNLSVSGIALAQQQATKKELYDTLPDEERTHSMPWILGGVGLAVLGAVVVTIAFLMQTQAPLAPVTMTAPDALIPGVEETVLDVTDMTRTKLSQTLSALPSAYTQKTGISLVRLVTYADTTDADRNVTRVVKNMVPDDFFATLSARNTDRLARSLGTLSYVGVVSKAGKTSPFLAFEVTSYESAFAGLLEWENTLPEDIAFMVRTPAPLPPPPTPALPPVSTSTVATTTPIQVPVAVPAMTSITPVFKDLTIKNKDTRALLGTDGSVRVLYSFLSQKLLIIAPDEDTLTAIIGYISTARFTM